MRPSLAALAPLALAALFPAGASAQEAGFYVGPHWDLSTSQAPTYQWRIDYQQGLGEHWYFETGWVNDGHIPGHLRDGVALQVGARTSLFSPKFSVGLATGVDRYYDTIDSTDAAGFADVQGFLWLTTAQFSYYAGRWIIRAQVNLEVAPASSYDALSAVLGLAYQLQAPDHPGPRPEAERQSEFTTGSEIVAYVGQTVPNGGSSDPKGIAGELEFRRGVWRYMDWTVSWINQGDNAVLSRVGLATQLWPTRRFGRLSLGIGLGVYFAVDQDVQPAPGTSQERVAFMVSPSAGYRIGDHWVARFLWNRTVTWNSTNTDFFSLGLGYRL